jgi:alkylated DNA nucleotide flippase Atl1
MNILDHKILIPASPEAVWRHISDITQNPTWQVDCRSISFLSSRRDGPGVRWRYTTDQGRECVVETTAWYDGLGYEYTFVDGVPYRSSRGRLRLQEIPEGTVVQWTFNYEIGGVIGGVRNAISVKRNLENMMTDSLQTLWRYLKQSGVVEPSREAKSAMRDALDYEARANYKPRHPSALANQMGIVEPPIAEDDTRPRPAVTSPESDFLGDVPADDRQFMPPHAAIDLAGKTEEEIRVDLDRIHEIETQTDLTLEALAPEVNPSEPLMDTSEISVFEVFGLPKPSETQEMRAISLESAATATAQSAAIEHDAETLELPIRQTSFRRVGQRILARRKLISIRRP